MSSANNENPVRKVEIKQVIFVTALAGDGTQEAPHREIRSLHNPDGTLICYLDEAQEAQWENTKNLSGTDSCVKEKP